jgi:hypothetical protein
MGCLTLHDIPISKGKSAGSIRFVDSCIGIYPTIIGDVVLTVSRILSFLFKRFS